MELEVCITLRKLNANLGSLKNSDKWNEQESNLFTFAYLSPNCNGESDLHSCFELVKDQPVSLRTTCFEKLNPSARVVVELQCIIKTAEDTLCKHTLGRTTVPLSSISNTKPSLIDVTLGLRREAFFTAGDLEAHMQIVKTPGFKTSTEQTFFVGPNVDKFISLGQTVVQNMLNLFFSSPLRPVNKALHSFHCPYLNGVIDMLVNSTAV